MARNVHVAGIKHVGFQVSAKSKDMWTVDTGVTNHMTSYLELLFDIQRLSQVVVKFPDGSQLVVTQMVSIWISSDLILQNVFYVPTFTHNFLYVRSLHARQGMDVIFDDK